MKWGIDKLHEMSWFSHSPSTSGTAGLRYFQMVHVYNDIIKNSTLQCLVLRSLNVDREANTDLELVTINEMDIITFPPASSSHSFTRLLVKFPESEYPISPTRNSARSIWGNLREMSGERLLSLIFTPRRKSVREIRGTYTQFAMI